MVKYSRKRSKRVSRKNDYRKSKGKYNKRRYSKYRHSKRRYSKRRKNSKKKQKGGSGSKPSKYKMAKRMLNHLSIGEDIDFMDKYGNKHNVRYMGVSDSAKFKVDETTFNGLGATHHRTYSSVNFFGTGNKPVTLDMYYVDYMRLKDWLSTRKDKKGNKDTPIFYRDEPDTEVMMLGKDWPQHLLNQQSEHDTDLELIREAAVRRGVSGREKITPPGPLTRDELDEAIETLPAREAALEANKKMGEFRNQAVLEGASREEMAQWGKGQLAFGFPVND
jgi:hypothetical protein